MDVLGRTEVGPTKALFEKVRRITDIFEALLLSPPPVEHWPEWISRLIALMAQYENTLREVKHSLAKYLVTPNQISNNLDFIPNILLRTRMAPEVEEHLAKLETGEETGNMLRAISQILQEGADMMKSPPKIPTTPLGAQDEDLLNVIKKHYTAVR